MKPSSTNAKRISLMQMVICLLAVVPPLVMIQVLGCESKDTHREPLVFAGECAPADPNAAAFERAVCLCEGLDDIGNGLSTESLATFLGHGPSPHRASVGINGAVAAIGNLIVDGTLQVGQSLSVIGNVRAKDALIVQENVTNAGRIKVDGDARIGGDLSGAGYFKTDQGLQVGGNLIYVGALFYESLQREALGPEDKPCACGPDQVIDVARIVAGRKNAQPLPLPSGVGHDRITLKSGEYYTKDDSSFLGNSILEVKGSVRLFVDADVRLIGNRLIHLAKDAQLDLYIAGSVESVGNFMANFPDQETASRAVRIYIGGSNPVNLTVVGNEIFYGALYAPTADVQFIGNLMVFGAVFARSIRGFGNVMVVYNGGITGESCEPIPPEPPAVDPICPPGDDTCPAG